MKNIIRSIFVIIISFLVSGCMSSTQNISIDKNIVHLKFPNNDMHLQLKKPIIHKFNRYVARAYTIEEGAYHIEYIRRESNVNWNGLASGYFRYHFIQEFKGAKTEEILDLDNIKAYKYLYNAKYVYVISIHNVYENTFIVDYTGFITSKIFEQNLHIPIGNQVRKRLKKSLLDNYLENYFSRDIEYRSRWRL